MRGLSIFISDIRNCLSKEAEIKQINKELANIRSKFKGDKTLSGYQKKKYVCKLLFIFLLGHELDFGHNEAVNLLCCSKYSEKQIGYLFISVLSFEDTVLMNLVMTRMREDLNSSNTYFVNLALRCIANIGTVEMAENFARDIIKLLTSSDAAASVKQNAALCVLTFLRVAPSTVASGDWKPQVVQLLTSHNLGVVTTAASLIDALAKENPDEVKGCVSYAISRLELFNCASYMDLHDYTYYFVPAPWLSVKLLRLLQNYPPPDDLMDMNKLNSVLDNILAKAQEPPKSKKVQHSNAKNAVLFEAINLIIHMDCSMKHLTTCCTQLSQFLQHKETNLRYLTFECLCLLSTSEFGHEAVKKHQEAIISELKTENDISVRQRAVDLLYAMCDRTNAEQIVGEMLDYLEVADYSIREEMVLKVAILAEKYATDFTWYLNTMLNLIRVVGDVVSEEVWHRVVHIVANREEVQAYAAKMVFQALQAPACHENMIKVGAYILGEFGNLIAGDPSSSPEQQFNSLHNRFYLCTAPTRQLMLSTYVKLVNLFPELRAQVVEVLSSDAVYRSTNTEIQQRAAEYLALLQRAPSDVLATVLEEMPPFPERESSILAKLRAKNPNADVRRSQKPETSTALAIANNVQPPVRNGIKNSTEVDLLGLNNRNSVHAEQNGAVQALPASDDFLSNVFGNGEITERQLERVQTITRNNLSTLLSKQRAVLYEDAVVQIGLCSQSNGALGRLTLFYGNKSAQALTAFETALDWEPAAADPAEVLVQLQPGPNQIEPGQQTQQLINLECRQPFVQTAMLRVSFGHDSKRHQYHLALPIALCKFMKPCEMDRTLFSARWNSLCQPGQECVQEAHAQQLLDPTAIKTKLLGSGLSVLSGIDPNPLNFVSAAILNTSTLQIGVLLRLEPNSQTQNYRLTVRSTHPLVARRVNELVRMQM